MTANAGSGAGGPGGMTDQRETGEHESLFASRTSRAAHAYQPVLVDEELGVYSCAVKGCVALGYEHPSAEEVAYRIEADNAVSEYDALEVDAGIMLDALAEIAAGRPNRSFDPWAQQIASKVLGDVSERVKGLRPDA